MSSNGLKLRTKIFKRKLPRAGTMTKKEIEDNYAISRRIEAEERALETATMVLTSTQQEIDEQWGLYDGCVPCLPSQ